MRNALALSLFFCAASTAVFACTKEEARVGSASTTNAALPAVATTELAAIEAPGAPEAAPKKPEAPSACPDGMILVDGMYCPSAEEKCLEWMEPP
ncbi:MAG: hypothetical protein ACREJX_01785, partial [Polyangiaceae bacterium]